MQACCQKIAENLSNNGRNRDEFRVIEGSNPTQPSFSLQFSQFMHDEGPMTDFVLDDVEI